jgi:hypothetical protein
LLALLLALFGGEFEFLMLETMASVQPFLAGGELR